MSEYNQFVFSSFTEGHMLNRRSFVYIYTIILLIYMIVIICATCAAVIFAAVRIAAAATTSFVWVFNWSIDYYLV